MLILMLHNKQLSTHAARNKHDQINHNQLNLTLMTRKLNGNSVKSWTDGRTDGRAGGQVGAMACVAGSLTYALATGHADPVRGLTAAGVTPHYVQLT